MSSSCSRLRLLSGLSGGVGRRTSHRVLRHHRVQVRPIYTLEHCKDVLATVWTGLKGTFHQTRGARPIHAKIAEGEPVSRAEFRLAWNNGNDLRCLLPLALAFNLPFIGYVATPLYVFVFAKHLPTTYQTDQLKAMVAKQTDREAHNSSQHIRDMCDKAQQKHPSQMFSNPLDANFLQSQQLADCLDISRLSRTDLEHVLRLLDQRHGLPSASLFRARIQRWHKHVRADDRLIFEQGGPESLNDSEIREACRERGLCVVDDLESDQQRLDLLVQWFQFNASFEPGHQRSDVSRPGRIFLPQLDSALHSDAPTSNMSGFNQTRFYFYEPRPLAQILAFATALNQPHL